MERGSASAFPPLLLKQVSFAESEVMMFGLGIGAPEMLLVGLLALLFFGNRVPEVMRSIGRGISEFKSGLTNVQDEIRRVGE
jgi:TatA/E family protein of Tat protein translocase